MLAFRKLVQAFCFTLLFSLSLVAQAESLKDLFHYPDDPVLGNPKGKVTIVEFFDYQCGHCIAMTPVINAIIKANPDVRVVYKELPIRGPVSQFAAEAALVANQKAKYEIFSHALLGAPQPLTEEAVLSAAKQSGLGDDSVKLKTEMRTAKIATHLKANENLARDLQLTGTPAFFIGKTDAKDKSEVTYVLGEMSQTELQSAIDKAKV